jgi:hypothetical protein
MELHCGSAFICLNAQTSERCKRFERLEPLERLKHLERF